MTELTGAVVQPSPSLSFSLKPLMFETFVCSMAMMAFVALAGPIARVIGLDPWHVGTAVTIAGIGWMIMARIWGAASDRRGRRPILLFGLSGFVVSYALLALFIDSALRGALSPALAFAGLVVGRGLAGLFYAAVPSTSAALVADHVPPDKRAAAMAGLGAASAAGLVVGPGLAGLIGSYSLRLPLYGTAILPALALIVLWQALPRDTAVARRDGAPLKLSDGRLRRPMLLAFSAMFSVSIAQITVGFFALDRLHLPPAQAAWTSGIALATVGVALVGAQLALRALGWAPARFIRLGMIIGAIGFGSVIFASTAALLWLGYAVAAFGMGWVFPSVSAMAANAVQPHEQGATAGTVAAAQGLGVVLGPIAGTTLYTIDNGAPYAVVALLLLLVGLWSNCLPERSPGS
ncbi:MFS transporter [Sphingobium sp. YR768]|uniref:MFS transporter n=1 Tax=Sphingobium sp. YR768 TaxID=1884365 RepID=UPI0008C2EABB|nr:MFS transporter [Sphingobium sp. YR768]SER19355.1 Predicted arabinose efflux permease, MFS family [Sphingobium sp. YR768]